jgi:hypothetical protein
MNTPKISSWDDARSWEESANDKREDTDITWSFDCNFKLDFDGSLISVSSRFYPPSYNNNRGWEGKVDLYCGNAKISTKDFFEGSLDTLRGSVEAYIKGKKMDILRLLIS